MGAKDKMKKKDKVLFILVISTLIVNFFYQDSKTVEITYKEYKAGNSDNLVLDKILSDNELKEEIPHMFNYASNGNYFDGDNWEYLNDPEYITEGLYSNKDEDGTTYYYRGNIDNNNIVFGTYDEDYYVYGHESTGYFQTIEAYREAAYNPDGYSTIKLASKGDKIYWKIVRVNGDGSLRLIYNGPGLKDVGIVFGSFSNEDISGPIGASPYNLRRDDPKYTGYTYDNGVDSILKKEVDTWYNNTLGSNSDYDSKVILGRFCSDSSGYNYNGEGLFSNANRLDYWYSESDIAPTFICPETSESYGGSYRLKAGLITADEVVFAGENNMADGNSYLNIGASDENYWTMTPSLDSSNWGMSSNLSSFYMSLPSFIRPVINIMTDDMTLTGDGTADNPYQLEEITKNNYKGTVTIEEGSSVDDVTAFEEELNLDGVNWTSNDESIARIENGKILGLKEGTTTITGVSSDRLTNYLIEVNVIKNPVTNSMIYVSIGVILILVLGTALYAVYRIKTIVKED